MNRPIESTAGASRINLERAGAIAALAQGLSPHALNEIAAGALAELATLGYEIV